MPTTMTDYIRIVLYALLIMLCVIAFQTWDKEHAKQPIPQTETTETAATTAYIPKLTTENTATISHPVSTTIAKSLPSHPIHIVTDVMDLQIDPLGGNITQVKLLQYPEQLHSANPVVLLNSQPETKYIAQSGLLSSVGPDTPAGQALYLSEKSEYTLLPGQDSLQIKLFWQNKQGLKVTKIFTLHRNNYAIEISYLIQNLSHDVWEGSPYEQLMRKNTPASSQGVINLATFYGAAISSPSKPFEKISFKKMQAENLNQTITGGWAAMIQHYFISAWIPNKNITSQYFSKVTEDGLYTIGMLGSKITVSPGSESLSQTQFYAGPAIPGQLEKVAPGLQLTIDYGWFWIISTAIFWMMQKIYNVIGNWGWSIVLVTLIIKLMFYHLSAKSYRSMTLLKKLQPRIESLKERFGNDKQKLTQATLELYRKEKVNPMSGCLPILIQIPVFIGLYWVLIESVELRQAPFIFWIQDLTTYDPYYVLPVLMGLSMFLQQRLNPPMPDPVQAKVMMLMPIVFTVLFIKFPAGLMLYWFVNNTLSFLQQWYIMRSINGSKKPKTHSSQ